MLFCLRVIFKNTWFGADYYTPIWHLTKFNFTRATSRAIAKLIALDLFVIFIYHCQNISP
jgi:hypothetical protein